MSFTENGEIIFSVLSETGRIKITNTNEIGRWIFGTISRSVTYNIDTLIQKLNINRNYNIDILIQKLNIERTLVNDILLILLLNKNYSIDTLIQKLNVDRSEIIDLILQKAFSQNQNIDILIKKLDIDTNQSIDVLIQKLNIERNYNIDIVLENDNILKDYIIDVLIKKLNIDANQSVDILIQKFDLDRSIVIDALIVSLALDRNYVLDIFIKKLNIDKNLLLDLVLSLSGLIQSQSHIYLRNAAEIIKRILNDNWNSGNVPIPSMSTQMNPTKRLNYRDEDWIIIDYVEYSEKYSDILRDFVDTSTKVKLNVGTTVNETRLNDLFTEIRRILYTKRRDLVYDSFDIVSDIKKVNKSNTKRNFYVMDVEFDIKEVIEAVS